MVLALRKASSFFPRILIVRQHLVFFQAVSPAGKSELAYGLSEVFFSGVCLFTILSFMDL